MAWAYKTKWTQEQIDDLKQLRERMHNLADDDAEKPFAPFVIFMTDWQLSRIGPDLISEDRL